MIGLAAVAGSMHAADSSSCRVQLLLMDRVSCILGVGVHGRPNSTGLQVRVVRTRPGPEDKRAQTWYATHDFAHPLVSGVKILVSGVKILDLDKVSERERERLCARARKSTMTAECAHRPSGLDRGHCTNSVIRVSPSVPSLGGKETHSWSRPEYNGLRNNMPSSFSTICFFVVDTLREARQTARKRRSTKVNQRQSSASAAFRHRHL